MNKTVRWIVLVVVAAAALLLGGCATTGKGREQADVAAIQEIWKTYAKAATTGDATLWLSLYDENGIQLPPDTPARPKKVLNEVVPKGWAAMKIHTMDIKAEEIVIIGGFAYSRGTYTSDRTVGGQLLKIDGKFLTLFRRQADGTWRIYRDCFNSNVPPK
jgi:ketosteroid isomerase-like protein